MRRKRLIGYWAIRNLCYNSIESLLSRHVTCIRMPIMWGVGFWEALCTLCNFSNEFWSAKVCQWTSSEIRLWDSAVRFCGEILLCTFGSAHVGFHFVESQMDILRCCSRVTPEKSETLLGIWKCFPTELHKHKTVSKSALDLVALITWTENVQFLENVQ